MSSLKYRSTEKEWLDDIDVINEKLIRNLDEIASINKKLGGNNVILNGLNQLIQQKNSITIVDIGCGSGDLCRVMASYLDEKKISYQIIGIDMNPNIIEYAKKMTTNSFIRYEIENAFSSHISKYKPDIITASLFLHHMSDNDIRTLVKNWVENVTVGVLINDLHRSRLSLIGFKLISFIFRLSEMSKHDGLISIKKGFRKKELLNLASNYKTKTTINWKWAFRWLFLIYK